METESSDIPAITNTFDEYPQCFSREEILQIACKTEEALPATIQALDNDPRFISIEETDGDKYFISKKTLYHWYVRLNIRLANVTQSIINNRQLTALINTLHPNGRWSNPPLEYVQFGQNHNLITYSPELNVYGFPIAYTLSFLTSAKIKHAEKFMFNISYDYKCELPLETIITRAIQDLLDKFTKRERYIITKRNGILDYKPMTLEQIGQEFDLTRERIRQIENKCWNRIIQPKFGAILVTAFILYIWRKRASILVYPNELIPEIKFLAKCLNIPISRFLGTDHLILGRLTEGLKLPEDIWKKTFDIEELAGYLITNHNLVLIYNDLKHIANSLAQKLIKSLTKSQKVFLVLKQMGEPSHYSEVTQEYNMFFPKNISTEHTIHAVLLREEYGVVWIGTRGTFALEEWGYERPSQTLFESVTQIVEEKYKKTERPVPFNVVVAEIGKYRKAIQLSSIIFATHCNSKLERVKKDYFVPKTGSEEDDDKEISKDELDKILQKFERRSKGEMVDYMTYEKALQIANEALEAYKNAKTKKDIEEIFVKYGRKGVGYRPLCRIFFSQMAPEMAVKVYKRE